MGNCEKCGSRYTDELYCKKCGAPIEENISNKINRYLFQMASNNYSVKNFKLSEEYVNKLLKNDPHLAGALILKGNIFAWTSPGDDLSYGKSIKCWIDGLKYLPEETKPAFQQNISTELKGGFCHSVDEKACIFSRDPSIINGRTLVNCRKYIDVVFPLKQRIGIEVSEEELSEFMAKRFLDSCNEAVDNIDIYFGKEPEEKCTNKYIQWKTYMDSCISVLEKAAELAEETATVTLIYDTLIKYQNKVIAAKSYKEKENGKGYIVDVALDRKQIDDRRGKINFYTVQKAKKIKEIQKKK